MLDQNETLYHIRKAKEGDENSKAVLYTNNMPLIKSLVRRFINKGIEKDDLMQIASIGLLKAINNFDEKFQVKFSTYSVPMIVGEIKRYIRDNGAVKVSRSLKSLANKINKFICDYQNNSPSIEEIAKHFNCTEEEVIFAMDSNKMPLSIFDKFEDDEEGLELIDKIPSVDNEDKIIENIHLSNILDKLTEKERKLIILRFYRDKTQSEVANTLGVSQVQVSRLETKILEKLRLTF